MKKLNTRLNYLNGDPVFEGDKVKLFNRIGIVVFYVKEGAYCLYTKSDDFYVQLKDSVVKMLIQLK